MLQTEYAAGGFNRRNTLIRMEQLPTVQGLSHTCLFLLTTEDTENTERSGKLLQVFNLI
jgi:hypothetical protein